MSAPLPRAANSALSFVPDAQNARQYRRALGQFGTGVTIVTVNTDAGPVGMTVNSFASVSLDPPLILWSVSKDSARCALFENADQFVINVLHRGQADLASEFARPEGDFAHGHWAQNENTVPVLGDALACFECKRSIIYDGGDHSIIVGQVEKATLHEGDPLLFFNGQFGSFDS